MQKRLRKTTQSADLRLPLVVVAVVGLLLLIFYVILTVLTLKMMIINSVAWKTLLTYGIVTACVYLIIAGYVLTIYLLRHKRITLANEAAELMTTEIGDMFRYVVNIPYAIADEQGMVKIVSNRLQEILQFASPICNQPLSSFCRVPIEDVVTYVKTGKVAADVDVSTDGVEDRREHPMFTILDGRRYDLRCFGMRSHGKDYYFIIFDDTTELEEAKDRLRTEDPVVAYVVIDNLQELTQYVRVNYKTAVNEIEIRLRDWIAGMKGLIREYEREKYLLVFNRRALEECLKDHFSILDTIRNIQLGDNSFPVTISIGVGAVEGSVEDKARAASDALDIALQKGGDQAAVNNGSITIYGGRVNAIGGSTTITSRVNSAYLCKLISEAGNVLIMGHRNPDYDSIGSCVGLARLAISARGGDASKVRVVVDRSHENFRSCFDILGSYPEYRQLFINGDTAKADAVREDTLLILTDVSNPANTESPKLFEKVCAIKSPEGENERNTCRVVIVDHHRRPDQLYTKQPLLVYIRPKVPAAGELVSEMIQQSPYYDKLLKEEANLLLAGIMLDTKNFTLGVTPQTFLAAEYLYSRGANADVVKGLFAENVEDLYSICDIESHTRIYRGKIAITWQSLDHSATENDSVNMAKAADRLMNIKGVEASFALLRHEDTVSISARSRNKINVEVIMKRLGGGGHYDMAGGVMTHTNLEEACVRLKAILDDYLDNEYEQEKGARRA
ncbi:MAG: DHH family phosphoesterase [Clostridia bacterium]|nr:DHH family phosphoesterase [Clostridia bacterium]